MLTDYKIVEERELDGILYQKVRYYEGEITTENEIDPETGNSIAVTRYRRSLMYDEVEYEYAAV